MFNMDKNKFLGFRADEDTLKFVAEEAKKANETMSDWMRGKLTPKKGK